MADNILAIGSTIVRQQLLNLTTDTVAPRNLELLFENACRVAFDEIWFTVTDEQRFASAIAGMLMHIGDPADPDYQRLTIEIKALKKLNAAINAARAGVGIDVESLDTLPDDFKAVGLTRIFHRVKVEKTATL